MTSKLSDTLFLVIATNSEWHTPLDRAHRWHLPHGIGLRTIYDQLGPGSQAFIFHDALFGDPNNFEHDLHWGSLYIDELIKGFGRDGELPDISVHNGYRHRVHGDKSGRSLPDDRVYGRQTAIPGQPGIRLHPTAIRLISREVWAQGVNPDADHHTRLREGVLRVLGGQNNQLSHPGNPAIVYDPLPVAAWLNRPDQFQQLNVRSDVYRRIAFIRPFYPRSARVDFTVDLQPVSASSNS